ncbi:periplasmic heavy metal sensor [Flavobacterium sp. LMO8]|uniref:periplasmic heavy metal sensor n=1 Tax=Flavobacterium sp. LMO8 TaxID=2654244 RepID=UPI0012922764|nr:periplasmic heavy metal sensor [Flavobacterium sp. LMO8]MQP24232.1 periplasmic heavy metal sensor [Flavobacterium sp. LMO8]
MTKSKLLTFAVIALFLINIITLSFLFFKGPRPDGRPKHSPSEIVIDILDFDEQQIIEYKKLIDKHSSQINDLDQKINETKNRLYLELASKENDSKKDSILTILNKYTSEVEQVHFDHFLEIKKLCKPEQLDNYNKLILDLSSIFAPPLINHKNDK